MKRRVQVATSSDPTLAEAIARVQTALRPVLAQAATERESRTVVFAVLGVAGELVLRLVAAYPAEGPALWAGFGEILNRAFPGGNPTTPPSETRH